MKRPIESGRPPTDYAKQLQADRVRAQEIDQKQCADTAAEVDLLRDVARAARKLNDAAGAIGIVCVEMDAALKALDTFKRNERQQRGEVVRDVIRRSRTEAIAEDESPGCKS